MRWRGDVGIAVVLALLGRAPLARADDCPNPPDRDYSALERGIADDQRLADLLNQITIFCAQPYAPGSLAGSCKPQRDACHAQLEHHQQTPNEHDESVLLGDIHGGWLGQSYDPLDKSIDSLPPSEFDCDGQQEHQVDEMVTGRRAIAAHHRAVIAEWGRWRVWAWQVADECRNHVRDLEQQREQERQKAEDERRRQQQAGQEQRRQEEDREHQRAQQKEFEANKAQAKVRNEEATKLAGELLDVHHGVQQAETALAKVVLHGVRSWQLDLYPGFLVTGLHLADWRNASGVDWLHFGAFGVSGGFEKFFWFAPPDPATYDGVGLELVGHAGIDTIPLGDEALIGGDLFHFSSTTARLSAGARLWLGAFALGAHYDDVRGWVSDIHRDELDFPDGKPTPAPWADELRRWGPSIAWGYHTGRQEDSSLIELRWMPFLHADPRTFALHAETQIGLLTAGLEFSDDIDAKEPGEQWSFSLLAGIRAVGGPDTMEVEAPPPPATPEERVLEGNRLFKLKDYAGALRSYDRALVQDPTLVAAELLAGEAARAAGAADDCVAITHLRRAVALLEKPGANSGDVATRQYRTALTELGEAYASVNDVPAERRTFARLNARFPEDPAAHYDFACALALSGQSDDALEELRHALRLKPTLAPWAAKDPDLTRLHALPAYREALAAEGVIVSEPAGGVADSTGATSETVSAAERCPDFEQRASSSGEGGFPWRSFTLRAGLSPLNGVLGVGLAWHVPGAPLSLAAGSGTHVFGGGLSFDLFPLVRGWWPISHSLPYVDLHVVRIQSFFAAVPTGWGYGGTVGLDVRPAWWFSIKVGAGPAWTTLPARPGALPLAFDLELGPVL